MQNNEETKRFPIFLPFYFLPLSDSHAGLDHVYHIVAELFALVDQVHIDGTNGVSILVVVDVGDVLRLQLVAEVIDLVLNVEGTVHIITLLTTTHQLVHLRQRVVRETHHLVDMAVLLIVEVVLLAVNSQRWGMPRQFGKLLLFSPTRFLFNNNLNQ